MWEIILDGVIDCVKILPFLFLSYLAVEYAEHKMSGRTKDLIYRAGKAGPVIGGLIGIIPQCGFSAAAAGLYAGGILSPGTLIAVFLSTSDEMLPVMLSEGIAIGIVGKILAVKAITGIIMGLLVDLAVEKLLGGRRKIPEHQGMCEHHHCGCEEHGIFQSALHHTVQIGAFLLVISIVIGFLMESIQGGDGMASFLKLPGLEEAAAALVGMVPNCAASVLITQLYITGFLGSGALFSGLLCGAGTGLLVLFRENESKKESFGLMAALYVCGTAAGFFIGHLGIL